MTPSNSLWTAPSLERYRFPIVAITCLVAGATIYYAQTLYSEPRGSGNGLHRSNAGRRRRQRRSLGTVPESEDRRGLEEALDSTDQTHALPLGVAETDTDGVSEYSWEEQDEVKEKESQSLLLLLYKIAEEQSRRDGYVHRGVSCNSCNQNPIKGIRYRCANCADYDLCETCEAAHAHNREHLFWKIRIPAPHIGGSSKECLPPFYPGKPKATIQDLQREKVQYFCKETGYKAAEVEALWEQFRSLAAAEYRNDPDQYGLAIDRIAFDKCFVPRGSGHTQSPNLLHSRIFSYYDTNNDGLIGFDEFIRGLASLKKKNAAERLKRVFRAYDINDDGYVDRRDILRIFRAYYTITKDLMSDIVETVQEEDDQDIRDLVSSSQPISAGFHGPGTMRRDGRRRDDAGKARNSFGDVEITDCMGVIRDRRADPQAELNNIIGDYAEQARWESINPPYFPYSSPRMTGRSIHSFVTDATRKDVQNLLEYYGHHTFPSEPDSNEEAWKELRRQLQGHMALELLQRRNVRRTAIIQRLRRQSFFQDGDVTWNERDEVASKDFRALNADPRLHTQMEKDLRDIESSQLEGPVKNKICELVKIFEWPVNNTLEFGEILLDFLRKGWTREELCQGLDGYSPDSLQVGEFVKRVAQILEERASKAQTDGNDFRTDFQSSKSSQLRLGNEEWSSPKGTGIELTNGQDILLSVTEEALNELLDPVFKLREDLALIALWERRQRKVFRGKIIDARRPIQRCYILKHTLDVFCGQWGQRIDKPPLLGSTLKETAKHFKEFLQLMLSGKVNVLNGRRCKECLKNDHESWVRIGETCSHEENHSNPSLGPSEGHPPSETEKLDGELCPNCTRPGEECWILDLHCDRCGQPCSRIRKEELKIEWSIDFGGKSLVQHLSSQDPLSTPDPTFQNPDDTSESSDEDWSQQELVSLSDDNHFYSSQPGSPKSLCDDTPLEFEDLDDTPENLKKPMESDGRSRHSQAPNAPEATGESVNAEHGRQTPDPTLPQNRPTTVPSHIPSFCDLPASITFSATADGKRPKQSKDKAPVKTRNREPYVPNDATLKFWMCLDILEGDNTDRGGPGRINFDEFAAIMQGDKGTSLGFLTSWVDIGTF